MVHDVVKIDPDTEPVCHTDEFQQVIFRAITGGDAATLVLGAQVEPVPAVVAHGHAATALGGRWNPDGFVAGLGQFRHLAGQFTPTGVEVLQQGLALQESAKKT